LTDAEHDNLSGDEDRSIVENTPLWHCTKTMFESEWRLLTTLPDLPSAQSLAEILGGEGLNVQVRSEAGVLGQAAPSRLYVAAAQLQRAQASLAQRQLSEEELTALAGVAAPAGEEP
jgi:hypothetical protein